MMMAPMLEEEEDRRSCIFLIITDARSCLSASCMPEILWGPADADVDVHLCVTCFVALHFFISPYLIFLSSGEVRPELLSQRNST